MEIGDFKFETGARPATLVARRICDRFTNDGEEPALSVRAGVANYPQQAETIEDLLYAADLALYSMKSQRKHT